MLPFTFANVADYDKINPTDTISFEQIEKQLVPGKQFIAKVTSEKGASWDLPLNQSMNQGQIEWFKAGSALNLFAK